MQRAAACSYLVGKVSTVLYVLYTSVTNEQWTVDSGQSRLDSEEPGTQAWIVWNGPRQCVLLMKYGVTPAVRSFNWKWNATHNLPTCQSALLLVSFLPLPLPFPCRPVCRHQARKRWSTGAANGSVAPERTSVSVRVVHQEARTCQSGHWQDGRCAYMCWVGRYIVWWMCAWHLAPGTWHLQSRPCFRMRRRARQAISHDPIWAREGAEGACASASWAASRPR